jgi:hypothetical protein
MAERYCTHIGAYPGPYRCGLKKLPKNREEGVRHLHVHRTPEMVPFDEQCPECYGHKPDTAVVDETVESFMDELLDLAAEQAKANA